MALQSKNNFLGGINLDLDETRLPANTAQFIKNLTSNASINAAAAALAGSNKFAMQPMEGNAALTTTGIPSGTNYCIGFYDSTQTNEGYFFLYNSRSNHSVWVIDGSDGTVTLVYTSPLLPFQINPQYFLSEGRVTLELRSIMDPVTGDESNFKFLIFTNNTEFQVLLDVDAAIATNSYTTSYFTSSAAFYNPLELITLSPTLPIKCVKLNDPNAYVPVTVATSIDVAGVNAQGAGYAVGNTFLIGGTTSGIAGANPFGTPGSGYAVGDTFSINGGTGGTGIVTGIGPAGIVITFNVVNGGTGYSIASGVATTTLTGAGSGLIVNITSLLTPATGQVTAVGTSGNVLSFIITSSGVGYYVPVTGVNTIATSGTGSGLVINIISIIIPDSSKQNLLINEGWQFRIRTWDIWGRPSEWGIISSVFTSIIGGGCISTSNGLPRCVNLCFDAGNPLVKFITVAYRRGVGNSPAGEVETSWYEHTTFNKYDDSQPVEWYNRPINPSFSTAGSGMTFNSGTNIITYAFCADKLSNPIDSSEAARTEPGIARFSSSVFSVNKVVGLANNVYDFEPIPQPIIDNIQFSATPPGAAGTPCPAAKTHTIILYANIYGITGDTDEDIYPIPGLGGIYVFGARVGKLPNYTGIDASPFNMGQVFGDQANPGFIAYLAGTPYSVVGTWGNLNPATGIFSPNNATYAPNQPNIHIVQFIFTDIPAGKYLVRLASHHAKKTDGNLQQTSTQVLGIVPIGTATPGTGARRIAYASNPLKEIEVDCSVNDVNFNTTNDPMFLIADMVSGKSQAVDGYLYEYNGGNPIEMAVCYIHGSSVGAIGDAYGSFFTDHNGYFFMYSQSAYAGCDIFVNFCTRGDVVCFLNSGHGGTSGLAGAGVKILHGYGQGSPNPNYPGNGGDWRNQVYAVGSMSTSPLVTYPPEANRTIIQNITVCSAPSEGVPGIPVVMTKCQPTITDNNGIATIIAHNRSNYLATIAPSGAPYLSNYIPDYGSDPGDQDYLIFSQKGGCEWNACGTCNTSIADILVAYLACGASSSTCPAGTPNRTLCLTSFSVTPNGANIKGVQSGGKYPVAVVFHDVSGRHTSPQIKVGDAGYVFVPNCNDTSPAPFPSLALCGLQLTIPPGLLVDPVFTHMTVCVGSNVLFTDFFTWAADWVQYVDNTGVLNTANPTSIRIYLPSLNEYNKQYNFLTNVSWSFVAGKENSDPSAPRDVVQFIMNGDGSWLPPQKGAAVTYSKDGSFFTIDYNSALAGLQNGCLFKVVRLQQNTSGQSLPYYEQCLTLSITNGALPVGAWAIPYQDSYMLSRFVPVPIMAAIIATNVPGTGVVVNTQKGVAQAAQGLSAVQINLPPGSAINPQYEIIGDMGGGITPGGSTPYSIVYTSTDNNDNEILNYAGNNNNTNGVVVFSTKDFPATYPFFFESPSPSDLWGSHLQSKGRVMIPNPYEQQYRVGTEIALSNPIADRGIVNGMGTFLEANRQVFDRNTFGDITVVLVEMGVCMVICSVDYFITRYNQTQIQITENGQLVGQNSAGSIFTAPQTKIGSNYGVIMQNINTIQRYAGQVVFLDNKGHLIFSDFSSAKPVEKEGYLGYLLNKIATINIANAPFSAATGSHYFIGGIDPKTMEYNLSSFNIPLLTSPVYINTQSQPNLNVNETLVFDMETGILKSFASFTPEYYGRIPGYYLQKQFLSFKNGIPYIHHNTFASGLTPPVYCNFYGTQCEVRIRHVVNGMDGKMLPDKVKRFLWIEVYCRQSIPGGTGVMPSALWFADVIDSEKGQTSRLLVARWDLRDGYQTAAFICASNTPPDPNNEPATTTNAILDGDPLQGRWISVSLTNNPMWTGSYFEISEDATYINGVEKSAE